MNAQQVLDSLQAGNLRFLNGTSHTTPQESLQKLKNFSKNGQLPKAIVLCCSDSRAPVELIFDQDIGDLFVIRVAGNIVAPSLVGSVEFAASTFGTQLVLVMGHTSCGAVHATLEHIKNPTGLASINIHDIVGRIKPHVLPAMQMKDLHDHDRLDRAVEMNVQASVAQLSHSSSIIERLVAENKITIRGAVFDLATGQVRFLEA